MTPQFWISVATLFVLIFGAWRGIVVYRRQMNAQLFLTFTQRFDDIMNLLADEAGCPTDVFNAPPPASDRLRVAVLRYLNLSSEEYYLHNRGYLSSDIWSIWEHELSSSLASPLIRREWLDVRSNYDSFPDFQAFVDRKQRG